MDSIFTTEDTIAAVASAISIGKGGVAIIRVSGKDAINSCKKIVQTKSKYAWESHRVFRGFIQENKQNKLIDEVLILVMKSPNSFTGEDVVELHCHGGIIIVNKVLKILLSSNSRVRLANPGEFSQRAFLNGKIDLTQAESINQLINASNTRSAELAFSGVQGEIKKEIDDIKNDLINQLCEIEARVDFEEDFTDFDYNKYLKNIKKIKDYFISKKIFLDVLVLNAGLQYTGSFYPKVSKQGIELTFAVNHLAHFYLVNVLKDFIRDKEESRIIITSSDVHDPKSSGGNIGKKAGLNNLVDFRKKVTGQFVNFNADEAYKNSKLCNILFAKELEKKLKMSSSKISVITWAPGLVIPNDDSGFFRYSKKFNLFGYLIFSRIAKNILGISESIENAGKVLSEIVIDSNLNNIGYIHLSNKLISFKKHKLVESKVSDEANSLELAAKLWIMSEDICRSFGFITFNI